MADSTYQQARRIGLKEVKARTARHEDPCLRALEEERMNLPFRAAGECAEEAILQSLWHAEADTALDGTRIPCLREMMRKGKRK